MKRKLVLKKEILVDLSTGELESVNAGQQQTQACPTNYCYPSWDVACRLSQLMDPCLHS